MSDDYFDPRDARYQAAPQYYWCSNCRREILFSHVEEMGKITDGHFLLTHTCQCSPDDVQERRFKLNAGALQRLLNGLRPTLPYRAAPGQPYALTNESERLLTIFAWECSQLESVAEFSLLATRRPLTP